MVVAPARDPEHTIGNDVRALRNNRARMRMGILCCDVIVVGQAVAVGALPPAARG